MKHGSFRVVCLLIMASIAAAAFCDENTESLEARILESFDGDSGYEWKAVASKFATNNDDGQFPVLSYIETWPSALFGTNRQGLTLRSLGIWGKFDRQGYNWMDIYPVSGEGGDDAGPAEIPIPGRVKYVDLWVWGSNLNYYIELFVRDHLGVVHAINMGTIAYEGWRNLRVRVPDNVPQVKRILPRLASLSFVKFRIWTQPVEQVANFYIYFDHFKAITDTFESIYDGDELADPERIQELWNAASDNG
ncbi:MAG: flagellar filament outer layer protein FlaA [Treponema sp.]|nr:flagellar filament outer layer protein FlaA [Treponema sp.]